MSKLNIIFSVVLFIALVVANVINILDKKKNKNKDNDNDNEDN